MPLNVIDIVAATSARVVEAIVVTITRLYMPATAAATVRMTITNHDCSRPFP